MWTQLAWLVVSVIIQYALTPKSPTPKASTLEDVDAPVAEDGMEVPIVFGTVWLSGPNVLWYGDLATKAIKTSSGK